MVTLISGCDSLRTRGLACLPRLLADPFGDTQMELCDDGGELYVSDLRAALAGALDCVHVESSRRQQEADCYRCPLASDVPLPGRLTTRIAAGFR
jgi:hypothetical protein